VGSTASQALPVSVSSLGTGNTAVAAGQSHSLAVHGDGTVWAWGVNTRGQLGDGTTTNRTLPVSTGASLANLVAAGAFHSLSLGACVLSCSASAPNTALPGESLIFVGSATTSRCSGTPTYDWDFGDGTAHSASPTPSHAYASPGTYSWQMTAAVGVQTCTQSGALTVLAPPVLSSIAKKTGPFRILVNGGNFKAGVQAFINGTPWPNLTLKSEAKVVLKGGASLKAAVPKGAPAIFRFVNPDGGWAEMTWTR
jgi:hypothetical protein